MSQKKKVILIAGPTASGKSLHALNIAQDSGGVIVNGDSMQIYDAIPTLTAQPTAQDRAQVPHRLYGILPASTACTVAKWHALACDEIDQCHQEGRLPIVVGGTGLYLDTLTRGLSYVPEVKSTIRAQVRQLCHDFGAPFLHEKLRLVDPSMAAKLNPNDKQRIMRAYEVIKGTGQSLLEWQQKQDTSRIKFYDVQKIFINVPRDILHKRAEQRLDKMLEASAIEEVSALLSRELSRDKPVMKALGVPEISAFLQKDITYEEMRRRCLLSTYHYIKRQQTWFRKSFQDAQILTEAGFATD